MYEKTGICFGCRFFASAVVLVLIVLVVILILAVVLVTVLVLIVHDRFLRNSLFYGNAVILSCPDF